MAAWIVKILTAIFGNKIIQTIIEVVLGTIAVDLTNLVFQGIKGLPGQQAIGNLNIGKEDFSKLLQSMIDNGDISSEAATSLATVYTYLADDSVAVKLVSTVAVLFNYFSNTAKIGTGQLNQSYNKRNRPNMPDPVYVMPALKWGGAISDQAVELLQRHGWSEDDIALVKGNQVTPLDSVSILQLYLNNTFDLDTAKQALIDIGFPENYATNYIMSTPNAPNIGALMSVLTGGAMDPDIADQYQLDYGEPQALVDWLKANGLPSVWSTILWRAHYTIPPIDMAYAAYNRGLINQGQLHTYYKSVNLPLGLYDLLDALASTPVSMLQAAEALQNGLIDPDHFKQIAGENGFDSTAQDLLLSVAQSTLNSNVTTATIQNIQYAISDGFITDDQGKAMFVSLGFTSAQADMQVSLAHYNAQYQMLNKSLSAIESAFKTRQFDANTTNSALVGLGLLPSKAQAYISLWEDEVAASTKAPTLSDIKSMMKYNIINESQAITYIGQNGYDPTTAARLAALYLAENGG